MSKDYGKEASELAIRVMKKARKVGITLIWVTVSPTADSIPRDVTRNTSHRVAFAVGDQVANDGLLGSGKYKAGIRATELVPGQDVGTAVTYGFTSKPFEIIRSHYVARDPEKGIDEVTPVVERALKAYENDDGVWEVPGTQPVDHLADVAAVLGDELRMLVQEVLHRLAERTPGAYRDWGPTDLKKAWNPTAPSSTSPPDAWSSPATASTKPSSPGSLRTPATREATKSEGVLPTRLPHPPPCT